MATDQKLSQLTSVPLPVSGVDITYLARITGDGLYSGYKSTVQGILNAATGVTYAVFTPLNNQPPVANFATLNTRNSIAVLDFDSVSNQSGVFVSSIPYNASLGSSVRADIKWVASTGAGNCLWGAQLMPLNLASNLNVDNFATAASGITTALTTGLTATTSLLITNLSGISPGDSYRLNVFRYATDANNTLQGTAQVHTVVLRGV